MKALISTLLLLAACGPAEDLPQPVDASFLPPVDAGVGEVQPVPPQTCDGGTWVETWISDGRGARLIFYCSYPEPVSVAD